MRSIRLLIPVLLAFAVVFGLEMYEKKRRDCDHCLEQFCRESALEATATAQRIEGLFGLPRYPHHFAPPRSPASLC